MRQLDLGVPRSDVEAAKKSKSMDLDGILELSRPLSAATARFLGHALVRAQRSAALPETVATLSGSDVLLRPCLPVCESCAAVEDTALAVAGSLLSAPVGHLLRRT